MLQIFCKFTAQIIRRKYGINKLFLSVPRTNLMEWQIANFGVPPRVYDDSEEEAGKLADDNLIEFSVIKGKIENTALLYFFHGSGCSGLNLQYWLENLSKSTFSFPHMKVVFPTAPLQVYQLNANRKSRVWFNRKDLSETSNEQKESVNEMCKRMLSYIEKEVVEGIPYEKIIVGGFSMGGALALHLAYRFNKPFAGCFAISSFLNHDSQVYESLDASRDSEKPPLLLMHGNKDALIPHEFSTVLKKNLEERGVNIVSQRFNDTDHEITKEELAVLKKWLLERLPSPLIEN